MFYTARGPNFKRNTKIPAFKNVDVYSLMCSLTHVKCHSSNGTIDSFTSVLQDVTGSGNSLNRNYFSFSYILFITISILFK